MLRGEQIKEKKVSRRQVVDKRRSQVSVVAKFLTRDGFHFQSHLTRTHTSYEHTQGLVGPRERRRAKKQRAKRGQKVTPIPYMTIGHGYQFELNEIGNNAVVSTIGAESPRPPARADFHLTTGHSKLQRPGVPSPYEGDDGWEAWDQRKATLEALS